MHALEQKPIMFQHRQTVHWSESSVTRSTLYSNALLAYRFPARRELCRIISPRMLESTSDKAAGLKLIGYAHVHQSSTRSLDFVMQTRNTKESQD